MKQKTKLCSTGHGTGVVQEKPLRWRAGRLRARSRSQAPLKVRRVYFKQREAWREVLKQYRLANHLVSVARGAGMPGLGERAVKALLGVGPAFRRLFARLPLVRWWRRTGREVTRMLERVADVGEQATGTGKHKRWTGNPRVQSIRERISRGEISLAQVPHHVQQAASRDTVRKWALAEMRRIGQESSRA